MSMSNSWINDYAKIAGFDEIEDPITEKKISPSIPYEKVKVIFDLAVKDYVEGKIDDKKIGGIAGALLYYYGDCHEVNKRDPSLGYLMTWVADLDYYKGEKGEKPLSIYEDTKKNIILYHTDRKQFIKEWEAIPKTPPGEFPHEKFK